MSHYSNSSLKTGLYKHISVISVIFGLTILGISSVLLNKLRDEDVTYNLGNNNGSAPKPNALVLVVSIGVVATLLQLVASIALWCTKDRDSKLLVFGFIGGQFLIQTILIICMGLTIFEHFKSSANDHVLQSTPNKSTSHGRMFWIILACNIIFHFGAVTYLIILVNKRSGYDDTEEMTAVVVHRRIPSRIPKHKQQQGIREYSPTTP